MHDTCHYGTGNHREIRLCLADGLITELSFAFSDNYREQDVLIRLAVHKLGKTDDAAVIQLHKCIERKESCQHI